jgi:hypothetical protein
MGRKGILLLNVYMSSIFWLIIRIRMASTISLMKEASIVRLAGMSFFF